MSGRLVPFATVLVLFALLPFLGGTTPQPPTRESVVLAAGSPAAEQAVDAVAVAQEGLAGAAPAAKAADEAATAVSVAFGSAVGGGLFMFPALSLDPQIAQVTTPSAVGLAGFIRPVDGPEASPFGPRIHPLLHRPMFHTGIDLMATCGTPIKAAADGTVIYARVSPSWGGRTIIEHTPGLKTAYGHQSKFLVKEGDVVKQGQVIGLVGTTGWSTGCHLHFDVIVNDRYVDPAPYLGLPASRTESFPYAVVPHLVLEPGGTVIHTVEDGDVPVPGDTSSDPTAQPTTTTTSRPSTPVPTTTTPAPTTTTGTPVPTTTTTVPPTTTTTLPPTTTTARPTTTGSTPSTGPTTTPPTTTESTTTTLPPTSTSTTTVLPTTGTTGTTTSLGSTDPTTTTVSTTNGPSDPTTSTPPTTTRSDPTTAATSTAALTTTAIEALETAELVATSMAATQAGTATR